MKEAIKSENAKVELMVIQMRDPMAAVEPPSQMKNVIEHRKCEKFT